MKKEYNNKNINRVKTMDQEPDKYFEDLPENTQSDLKNIFSNAKNFNLNSEEKNKGFFDFSNFLKTEGIAGITSKTGNISTKSPYLSQWENIRSSVLIISKGKFLTPVSVLALSILLASTCYAASDSLPGDVLYPVKVVVNEQVQDFVAITSSAKAIVNTKHAINRLSEAEALEEKGKLDDKISEDIIDRFDQESEHVKNKVEEFAKKGDIKSANEIETRFKESINDHNDILDKLSKKSQKGHEKYEKLKARLFIEDKSKDDKEDEEDDSKGRDKDIR